LPEGPKKKFFYSLKINYVVNFIFIFTEAEWIECLSKIRCNKNEKNI